MIAHFARIDSHRTQPDGTGTRQSAPSMGAKKREAVSPASEGSRHRASAMSQASKARTRVARLRGGTTIRCVWSWPVHPTTASSANARLNGTQGRRRGLSSPSHQSSPRGKDDDDVFDGIELHRDPQPVADHCGGSLLKTNVSMRGGRRMIEIICV